MPGYTLLSERNLKAVPKYVLDSEPLLKTIEVLEKGGLISSSGAVRFREELREIAAETARDQANNPCSACRSLIGKIRSLVIHQSDKQLTGQQGNIHYQKTKQRDDLKRALALHLQESSDHQAVNLILPCGFDNTPPPPNKLQSPGQDTRNELHKLHRALQYVERQKQQKYWKTLISNDKELLQDQIQSLQDLLKTTERRLSALDDHRNGTILLVMYIPL